MTAPLTSRLDSPAVATLTLEGRPLVEAWLAEQGNLTAVERFARKHERHELPVQARYYRDLIPLSKPAAGQQYAFDVDLDACTGCKACVTACHNLNGLDDEESFRDVGLLVGGSAQSPVLQHVTTACHHCLEPACLEGCPVIAYDKDEITGIVRHLDDQCIGCQYCILKCPYDAPKYNASRGIVRKCDMCSDRLKVGEAPACVQACPNQAIRITIVDRAEVERRADDGRFLEASPGPGYTKPTTIYRSRLPLPPTALAGDHHELKPQHAHPPLVIMLVLTQLSVGAFLVDAMLRALMPAGDSPAAAGAKLHALLSLAVGLLALGASTLHLGRPLYAFRAFIGLRTSWLSREIVAFGGFAAMASATAAATWLLDASSYGGLIVSLRIAAILAGGAGIFCSAMIYHDTRRAFWHLCHTGPRFALTTLWLGAALTMFTASLAQPQKASAIGSLSIAVALTGLIKLAFDAAILRQRDQDIREPQARTAKLMLGPLRALTVSRFILGGAAVLLPTLVFYSSGLLLTVISLLTLLVALAGELLERTLFFAAVVAPRMPGGSAR